MKKISMLIGCTLAMAFMAGCNCASAKPDAQPTAAPAAVQPAAQPAAAPAAVAPAAQPAATPAEKPAATK